MWPGKLLCFQIERGRMKGWMASHRFLPLASSPFFQPKPYPIESFIVLFLYADFIKNGKRLELWLAHVFQHIKLWCLLGMFI